MAINAQELNTRIIAAFETYNAGEYKNEKNTPGHLKILGDTMKAYLEEKTEITYTWAAVLPPPAATPDPVTSFKSTVSFPVFDVTGAKDLITLAALIQISVLGGVIKHPAGFLIPPGTYSIAKAGTLELKTTTVPEEAFYTCVSEPFCAWYVKCANPVPLAGTHGSFTGSTAGMEIS